MPVVHPSIDERLSKALEGLNLLKLAISADADDAGVCQEEIPDAILPVVETVYEHLYWAKQALGTKAGKTAAPDYDDHDTVAKSRDAR